MATTKKCSIEGCGGKHYGKTLCSMHYQRSRKTGTVTKREVKICIVDGCGSKHYGNDFCQKHWQRFKAHGDPLKTNKKVRQSCSVEGCSKPHYALGLCNLHRLRQKRGTDLHAPKRVWSAAQSTDEIKWNKNHNGYIAGYFGGKAVFQHRVVWEQHHGRKLHPFENIHHINGVRDDNRIENLELWTKPQPSGQRPEDLVEWVLDNYPDLVSKRYKKQKAA